MILLSDHAIKQCEGGQSLVGGLDAYVCRNYFGSQVQSSEFELTGTFLNSKEHFGERGDSGKFTAVFIRAPAILVAGPSVDILATIHAAPHQSVKAEVQATLATHSSTKSKGTKRKTPDKNPESSSSICSDKIEVIVAARQGNILATAFHPELTADVRWHIYFCGMVMASLEHS
jgi:pyridoxal 5'-phosphate synthase pdxT subunit